jgi:hypothetical protein
MPEPSVPQLLQEVDNNYIGLNSRLDPSNLESGFCQSAYNVRLQRGAAQPRKGCQRLTDQQLNSQSMVGSGTYVDSNGKDNIVLVFTDGIYLYNTEATLAPLSPAKMFPSQVIGSTRYYRSIEPNGPVDVVQALDSIYIFRGQEREPRQGTGGTPSTAALNLSFPAVSVGATVTVTATWINTYVSTHPTYVIGDEVTIFNVTDAQHFTFNNSYFVTGVGSNTFTFSYTNNTTTNINASSAVHSCVVKAKPPLVLQENATSLSVIPQTSIYGNLQTHSGYTPANGSLPPSDFGFYFQNRIITKFQDTQIAVSDILSQVVDFQVNTFIINQGGNDSIVGVLPWIENQFLIFMTKSIYIAYVDPRFDPNAPDQSQVTVVTTQVGCYARKSIVAAGQFVIFLSSKGVHVITPQLDLKLIGNTLPLSEPIDDFFDNLNFSAASKTVASYYENRFFIAVPINGATRPNAIVVYNTLNSQWESVDTYPANMFIDDYAVCQYQNKRRQFILTRFDGALSYGGIFLTEEFEQGDQFTSLSGSPALPFTLPAFILNSGARLDKIDARIRSREYTFGNTNEKRFLKGEYQFNNAAGDFVNINVRTHDPDYNETVLAYEFSGSNTVDSTLRPRIALRGASTDVEVQFVTGRPALKSATLYAIVANRSMVSQE